MKYLKSLLILLASVGIAFGQNPTVVRAGAGLTNANGKTTGVVVVGLYTNGASVGQVAAYTNAAPYLIFKNAGTGNGDVSQTGINTYTGTTSTNIYTQGSLVMIHTNIASPAGGAFIHFQSNPTMPDFLHADVTPSGAFTLARGYSSSILIGTMGFGNVGPILSHRNGGSLQLQDDSTSTQIKITTGTVTMGFDSTATEVNNYGTISHPNNPTISGAINFTGNVGYSTNGVAGKLILRKNGATFWAFNLLDGTDFVTNSNLTGVRVQAQNMNSAGARIGGGVLFMSGDPSFTTQTPKLLAAITHRATEGYASDTTGGSAIDFYVSSNGVGAVANPYVAGYWDQDGDLVCSNDFRVAGVTTLGSNGTSISSSQAGAITFDAPSIATLAQFNTNLTVTGAKAGSTIVRGSDLITAGIVILADCTNNGNIVIQLFNNTALSVDPANQTVRVRAINP